MKIAIVYDRVNKWGGAERVLLALRELFPDSTLFTSVYHEDATWAKVFSQIKTSFLNKISFTRDKHKLLAPLMPIAFESLDLTGFDLVISVTSEAAKSVLTSPGVRHVSYILTPTRYLWSGFDIYFENKYLKFISGKIIRYLKKWDKISANRPDTLVAISSEVKKRIKKYYGLPSKVLYPPVDLGFLVYKNPKLKNKNYYLIVSRLERYKKVDLAIETFNKLGLNLKIVGEGSQRSKLEKLAKKNIKFLGLVSDKKLAKIYQQCKALVLPQEEDFGIVALEAQAFGKAVLAYKKGGALDTIIAGSTGFFFEKQTVKSLSALVKRFDKQFYKKINEKKCFLNAKRFSKEEFKKNFRELIVNL